MLFYKNTFFEEELKLKNFSQLTFNQTFKGFKSFLTDEAFSYFDKRIISTISDNGIEEHILFNGILRKELIQKYNKQVFDNLFNFYEPTKNEKKLTAIFEENEEITSEQLEKVMEKYFSKEEKIIEHNNSTIIKINSFNEYLVFFIKKILQEWLKKQNKEVNDKKIFFPGKEETHVEIQMVQDIYINEGLKKTFSINYKMETPNYKINADLIKQMYYKELSILEFFNLNENYKKVIEKNHKQNKNELQFYFGNVYFIINTKQSYMINDLMNLLNTIGVNTFEIKKLPELDNKENYLTMSLLQLFKLNLGYEK